MTNKMAMLDDVEFREVLQDGIELPKHLNLQTIPGVGEEVPYLWKHNLGGGAKATTQFSEQDHAAVIDVAKLVAARLPVRFASVDVIQTPDGFKVMEVNSGVMLEKIGELLDQKHQQGREQVKMIYKKAIQAMFEPSSTAQETYQGGRLPSPRSCK